MRSTDKIDEIVFLSENSASAHAQTGLNLTDLIKLTNFRRLIWRNSEKFAHAQYSKNV